MNKFKAALLGVVFLLIGSLGAWSATPFLWEPGTSNNGLYASALTLQSTELNALTNSSLAVSTVGGASGIFTNSNTGQVIYSPVVLKLGAIGSALSTGANISCWFLETTDGSTFEATATAPTRNPDFIFALPATTIGAGAIFFAQGRIARVPALKFEVLCQNNTGQTLAATANTVALAPTAVQY